MRGPLPNAAKEMHICRHSEGVWNAVFSDQFEEQASISFGKTKGGLGGLTLSPDQVAGWVRSHHICNMVSFSMDDIFVVSDNENEEGDIKTQRRRM